MAQDKNGEFGMGATASVQECRSQCVQGNQGQQKQDMCKRQVATERVEDKH